jgi:acyl-coenzyme A thioesterase 13
MSTESLKFMGELSQKSSRLWHMMRPMDPKSPPLVGFDRSVGPLEIGDVMSGKATARLVVVEGVRNYFGNLHGGAIATLVDQVGTIAIMSADRDGRPGVTTDLNVSYFAPGKPGMTVTIEADVLKTGRTLACVEVSLRRDDGVLIARGRMTKHMG